MTDTKQSIKNAAERVIQLEEEIEAGGEASISGDALEYSKSQLRDWVETVVGVVASPGVGRVTLIHANGSETKIASPELPFLLSRPVRF